MPEAIVMMAPEKTESALEEWALNEIKGVSARNFEMSKHLFSISAGSFAIPAFFGQRFSWEYLWVNFGLFCLAASAFLALWMSEPADFKLDHKTNVSNEHARYALKVRNFRHVWVILWLVGVTLVFVGSRVADDGSADRVKSAHASLSWSING